MNKYLEKIATTRLSKELSKRFKDSFDPKRNSANFYEAITRNNTTKPRTIAEATKGNFILSHPIDFLSDLRLGRKNSKPGMVGNKSNRVEEYLAKKREIKDAENYW